MNIRKNIPNAITAGNLFCGCIALVFAFRGELFTSAVFVGLAALLDFLDGFAARLLKVSSPIGKDLDSLADMVTFGLVPGITVFHLFYFALIQSKTQGITYEIQQLSRENGIAFQFSSWELLLPYLAFFITVFSAIRLAKFNNDERQTDSFIGLPTPANAILIMSIPVYLSLEFGFDSFDFTINPLFYTKGAYNSLFLSKSVGTILSDPSIGLIGKTCIQTLSSIWFYIVFTFLFSYLLIAEIKLLSLKFKNFRIKGNESRFIFLSLSLLLIILGGISVFGLVIVLYLIISLTENFIKK